MLFLLRDSWIESSRDGVVANMPQPRFPSRSEPVLRFEHQGMMVQTQSELT
jgi:hypothetical protein